MPEPLVTAVERLLSGPRPLPIVSAGDPVLRTPAADYDGQLSAELLTALIQAMRESMVAAPGVGLAAPQIGLGVRIAVMQDLLPVPEEIAAARERTPVPFRVLINPSYRAVGNETASWFEGCLSVPGYQAVVTRARSVRLTGRDETGALLDEVLTGWPARIVAHETDHLAGRLYLDVAETRSLATDAHYREQWAGPSLRPARTALGFRTGSGDGSGGSAA